MLLLAFLKLFISILLSQIILHKISLIEGLSLGSTVKSFARRFYKSEEYLSGTGLYYPLTILRANFIYFNNFFK